MTEPNRQSEENEERIIEIEIDPEERLRRYLKATRSFHQLSEANMWKYLRRTHPKEPH